MRYFAVYLASFRVLTFPSRLSVDMYVQVAILPLPLQYKQPYKHFRSAAIFSRFGRLGASIEFSISAIINERNWVISLVTLPFSTSEEIGTISINSWLVNFTLQLRYWSANTLQRLVLNTFHIIVLCVAAG